MTRLALRLRLFTIVIAVSYLTLGIADSRAAARLWAPYAIVTLVLAVVNVATESKHGRR